MATAVANRTVTERVSVLETKVQHIDEKIDDLKVDVKEMHDCLDRTRDLLDDKLEGMLAEYRANRDGFYTHSNKIHQENKEEHAALAAKIAELERQKHKVVLYTTVGLAFAAGAGWTGAINFPMILKFFGL